MKIILEGKLEFYEDYHQFINIDEEDICLAIVKHIMGTEPDHSIDFLVPGKWRLTLEQID